MSAVALTFVGGIPFQVLYDGVKLGIRKSRKFKTQLRNLQITLDGLHPYIIQGIEDNNVQLHLPTETIRGLKTKMEEGKKLVDMMLKHSMWNIRIWGNCYNCKGPDWAEQLSELDSSLTVLLAQLEMEAKKNITDLVSLEIANKDKLDRLEKRFEILIDGQQRMIDMMREQNEAIGRIIARNNSVQQVASSSGGGGATPSPALGVVFQKLFDISMEVNVKHMIFKRLIERFKSTLHCLQPLIEEIAKYNRILHLPEEEVKNLIKQLKNGAELVRKCSKIRKRANYKKNEYITKILSLNNSLQRLIIRLKVQVEKSVKETSDSADKIEAVIKNIEAGGVVQIDDLGGEGHRPVEPGLPAVIRDVPQVNMEVSRDVIKEALVDSAKILIDQKWVKSNERSDVVQDQMETAAGLDVLSLQGSMDVETLYSTPVDSALKCATNIDKMGVDKNEESGESPIEIAVAAETEPPSPTVRDVPRNAKKETAEPHCSSPAKVKQPDKEEEAVLEHLKSRANARMTLLKKWFGRNNSCGKRKKGNVVLWIIPSNCNKESKVSTFCSCIKPFQKHSEETEMIMQVPFPDECIGNIISLTTPADACRLSLVSKRFKCAAESDQVWENFLPSPHLIHAIESQSTSSSTFVPAKSKKEFYLALCDNSVLMDNEKMSFSLDKWSGKKCYMICARELNIVWAQDKSRYWSWISLAESRFKEVASLDEVCWLEIRGKIDMSILSPWTLYKAYLVYKLTEDAYGFDVTVEVAIAERHYGFEYGPLDAALGGDENKQTVYLDPSLEIMDGARRPNERADGWLEMKLGEFLCQAEEDGELEMICAEYKDLCWKSGLIVQGIEVRPERKEYSEAKGKAGYFRAKGKKALFF
ncbi:hypothetical protein ACLB2K_051890 [Fragaria x ananassa]